jgi:hypothetical protein
LRKTVATIFILCVVSIGYTAWPLYDLLVLVRAMETRDIETVTRHVYFDAVRMSLTNQLVAAYVRRTGIQISPLAQSMAATALGITDPVVKKLISPEALSELLAGGWPTTDLIAQTMLTILTQISDHAAEKRSVRRHADERYAVGQGYG